MEEQQKLLEHIMINSGIPIHKLQFPFENIEIFHLDSKVDTIKESMIFQNLKPLLLSFEKEKIYFFKDFFQCSYAAFYTLDTLLLIGPILMEEISESHFQEMFTTYPALKNYGPSLFQFYSYLTVLPSEHFFKNICIEFANVLCGNKCTIVYTDFYEIIKENIEFDNFFQQKDSTYTYIEIMEQYLKLEDEFLLAVSTGNEKKALKKLEQLLKIVSFSTDSNLSRINSMKDYILTLHTCLRKMLEKNKVHPAHIGKLTSQILLETKQCTNMEQLQKLFQKMVIICCEMIKEKTNTSVSPLIDRILTYIQVELTGDLSLKAFAERLNVNTSYLSALFSAEMGMSLTKYVNQYRITYAKNLLENTKLSIHDISFRCGFSDAKYFSRVFKQITGTSPTTYRDISKYHS